MERERKGVKNKAQVSHLLLVVPLTKMGSTEESRSGLRVEDEFSLGVVELEVPAENPNGKYSEELGIPFAPRENSGLEIGISKSTALMLFEAVEDKVTRAGGVVRKKKV